MGSEEQGGPPPIRQRIDFEGHAKLNEGSIGSLFSSLRNQLVSPLNELGQTPVGGMTATGRQLLSQDMNAGFANLKTAAGEYTQAGFYRNMLFGTAPEYGAAGLHSRLLVEQQAGAMPFLPGNQMDSSGLQDFADQATRPFNGLLGFQKRFGETLMSAQQAGLGRYITNPQEMMQADMQIGALTAGIGKIYRVPTQEMGQLYTGALAAGVPMDQAQESVNSVLRAQNSGIGIQQSYATLARTAQLNSDRQKLGLSPLGSASSFADEGVYSQIARQQASGLGINMTPTDVASFGSAFESARGMGLDVPQALNIGYQQTFGAQADRFSADDAIAKFNQTMVARGQTEVRSAQISSNMDQFKRMASWKGMIGAAIAGVAAPIPGGAALAARVMGTNIGGSSLRTSDGSHASVDLLTQYNPGAFAAFARNAHIMDARRAAGEAYDQIGVGGGIGGGTRKGIEAMQAYVNSSDKPAEAMERFKADMTLAAQRTGVDAGWISKAANVYSLVTGGTSASQREFLGMEAGRIKGGTLVPQGALPGGGNIAQAYNAAFGEAGIGRDVTKAYNDAFRRTGMSDDNVPLAALGKKQQLMLDVSRLARYGGSADELVDLLPEGAAGAAFKARVTDMLSHRDEKTGRISGAGARLAAAAGKVERLTDTTGMTDPISARATMAGLHASLDANNPAVKAIFDNSFRLSQIDAFTGSRQQADYKTFGSMLGNQTVRDYMKHNLSSSVAAAAPKYDNTLIGASAKAAEGLNLFANMLKSAGVGAAPNSGVHAPNGN